MSDPSNVRQVNIRTDERYRWMNLINKTPGLPATAYRIAFYFVDECAGPKSLGIFPRQSTIASELEVKIDVVKRALRRMEQLGFIRRDTRAVERDRRSTYYLLMWPEKGAETHPIYGSKLPPKSAEKGVISSRNRGQKRPIEPVNEPISPPEGGEENIGQCGFVIGDESYDASNYDPNWHLDRSEIDRGFPDASGAHEARPGEAFCDSLDEDLLGVYRNLEEREQRHLLRLPDDNARLRFLQSLAECPF
ncbi:hypothetical protein HHL25_02915 [Rhizobium sp. S-51]|uniref:Helix-turn-helix domain-containing protein n=1 Tax=Rhizobium terricola TaxID=2728849 RepID=A0A7Y0ATE3_9HYPH|nr:hypothetical protein [Rhizobium terricola]NML73070.1 hypothetical protein [Rhizobium terricola]